VPCQPWVYLRRREDAFFAAVFLAAVFFATDFLGGAEDFPDPDVFFAGAAFFAVVFFAGADFFAGAAFLAGALRAADLGRRAPPSLSSSGL
jgi:hypothetical protein